MENKNFTWRPVSEYTGGRVLATNGLDVLIGEINSEGDCESEEGGSTILCGITGFIKIEEMLPEIVESEDEKIRKAVVKLLKVPRKEIFEVEGITKEQALAWLEKQGEQKTVSKVKIGKKYRCCNSVRYTCFQIGKVYEIKDSFDAAMISLCSDYFVLVDDSVEQKPDDKVEPKFKVGKWYLCVKDFYGKGVRFDKGNTYHCGRDGCLQQFDSGAHIFIVEELYEYFRLWTIQDAMNGDVLASASYIAIFKEIDGKNFYCFSSCSLINNNFYANDKEPFNSACFAPATKKQRDLLFQKMKEAGYEWDAEHKQLKKIEQKPAWSKEDEKVVNDILYIMNQIVDSTQHDEDNRGRICVEWIKNIKYRVKPVQSEWSEEDEEMFKTIANSLDRGLVERVWHTTIKEVIAWLKKLKDRVQPKQEWSEEDKKIISDVVGFIHDGALPKDEKEYYIEKLLSLPSQKQWKPSKEQMAALNNAILLNEDHYNGAVLSTLREQLKKLREE